MSTKEELKAQRALVDGPSFGGLLLKETPSAPHNDDSRRMGLLISDDNEDEKKLAKIEKRKQSRRRRSVMSANTNSAQGEQIKAMLEQAVGAAVDGCLVDGTPEERLQKVMTTAKDNGMAIDKIFSYFNGGNPSTEAITKEEFLSGLEKLGHKLFVLTDAELDALVKRFDCNNDGLISLAEFQKYCFYDIPHVSWKAERARLEANGEMDKIRRKIREERKEEENISTSPVSCGDEVVCTSKLFWKTNTTIQIKLYYCEPLDIITVQIYSEADNKALPSIYVKKALCAIDGEFSGGDPSKNPKGEWDDYAKYLSSRLQLKTEANGSEQHTAFLRKQKGDNFETLTVPKPNNLLDPPAIVKDDDNCLADFEERAASFARTMRRTRQSAQKLESVVQAALGELDL
eukprot:CAMPEP_0116036820 /NCGR_PEP_ID=MMETSP0321-20121206/21516_1 /TAXON_ID=163516 /ORGANISM="Leptocylindrus danicus var. danicus, Strain B650" /LENGTH=401 /DNA_ID=CAMNT_0003514567 /DNA_START=69 /DNA_END=1274 /DNA_ORIENTATION=-